MDHVIQISKWDEVFETAESRRHKVLSWVSMPIGFQSHGFQALIDEFGDEAPAIYGAWCALVALAATMPTRGVLASSRGIPLSLNSIARQTFFPVEVYRRLLEWAEKPEICWIFKATMPCPAVAQPPPSENLGYKTRQDPTIPNTTTTRQDPTPVGRCPSLWEIDFDSLERDAAKFRRVSNTSIRQVTTEQLLQMTVMTHQLKNGFLSDIAAEFREGRVGKPGRYVDAAIAKQCESAGWDLQEFRRRVAELGMVIKDAKKESVPV